MESLLLRAKGDPIETIKVAAQQSIREIIMDFND